MRFELAASHGYRKIHGRGGQTYKRDDTKKGREEENEQFLTDYDIIEEATVKEKDDDGNEEAVKFFKHIFITLQWIP